jgi:hypothetical protein
MAWQTFPDSRTLPKFAERLDAALGVQGIEKNHEIFSSAAQAAVAGRLQRQWLRRGYRRRRNVMEGLRSIGCCLDRRRIAGWKVAGLD